MKRDELAAMGIAEDAIDKIMNLNGADVEKAKAQAAALKEENNALKNQLSERDKDIDALKASAGDAESTKKRLDELESKYKADTETLQKQISERDYSDAIKAAIAEKNIKFSSKAAEKAFISDLKAAGLKLDNGVLMGFDDFHKSQAETDPHAFAAEQAPRIVAGTPGTAPVRTESKGASAAISFASRYLNLNKGGAEEK